MATSQYVVEGGELFRVVQVHERAELDQVKAVEAEKQQLVDSLQGQVDGLSIQLTDAQAALADAKSDVESATGVVEAAAAIAAGQPINDDGSVVVGVTVADQAQEQF